MVSAAKGAVIHRLIPMIITIEISNDSKIVAKSIIENNESFWAMHIDEENEPYDEYFTCDVFNLIKEEIAPIQN